MILLCLDTILYDMLIRKFVVNLVMVDHMIVITNLNTHVVETSVYLSQQTNVILI
jgi:hypothetical protein